jgi:hypothetical protein
MIKPEREETNVPMPREFCEWAIEEQVGPGPLGKNTATATARKGAETIQATASAPVIALEIIRDMIRRREEEALRSEGN